MKAVKCPVCDGKGTICGDGCGSIYNHATCQTCHGCRGCGWVSVPEDTVWECTCYNQKSTTAGIYCPTHGYQG